MKKTFEQIQHCAIVEYQSPLTQDIPVVGMFYKSSWEFLYYAEGKPYTIKVTPSQTCIELVNASALIYKVYMANYADLRTAKEKEKDSQW